MWRSFIFVLLSCGTLAVAQTPHPPHTFAISGGAFLYDGKPVQLISGEMHFARIPREYWRDRLKMARAMGLNTIATYVFWNYHEPEAGKFNFAGNADVAAFTRIAGEEGLWVIIRPSPYACAEWEFGGYPWWLINEKEMKVRSKDPRFLELSRRYFQELGKQLVPLQITRGGNIIMVQLENEYGSYSNDKEYLALNRDIIRETGFDVELYTCDGPSQMPGGYLPGLLPAVNGLDEVKQVRELVDKHHNGVGPYFIAEWYPAWFDTWGTEHHVVPAESYVAKLDEILAAGFSINMYMVHGGTTRGFMNGANYDDRQPYAPQTSSYDYDAPIDEAGNATRKYMMFREVIRKHLPPGEVLPPVLPAKPAIAIPPFALTESVGLFDRLPPPVNAERPLTFEDLRQPYGYVLYRTTVKGPLKGGLQIRQLRDYGLVYVNGRRVAVLDRRLGQDSVNISLPAGAVTLDILVENLGRINYGPYLNDNRKGITEKVTFNGRDVKGWKMYGFPFNTVSGLRMGAARRHDGPVIRRGTFMLAETADTYLDMSEWGKGSVWLNGHSIGRYWYIGPQQTLYVPGPWLKKGRNEVVIVELLNGAQDHLQGRPAPILDQLAAPTVSIRGRYDATARACLVSLESTSKDAVIHYTTDGSEPTLASPRFEKELAFTRPVNVASRAYRKGVPSDMVASVGVNPGLAAGKALSLTPPFSSRYPAGGPTALVDGFTGSPNYKDGFWQGFEGNDVEAVVDLGDVRRVSRVTSTFLQNTGLWIFFPRSVEVAVSVDGVTYSTIGSSEQPVAPAHEGPSVREFTQELNETKVRFVRVRATGVGVCPAWHPGAGAKAWTFWSEISID